MVLFGHKAIVRGVFIALGTKFEKERQAHFQWVLMALQQAELRHKHQATPVALQRLM